ncbi:MULTISPECIES: LysR family transcriptional regulator [Rhizobium]|uniref:LysR family transcriptional regulator n=1 Tax=Rhizobium TaxID=379 RepID=UPI001B3322AF|nr:MULTISPECIES: LysR family transcriptional regulator [Rhizobium]MBX4911514.1 LysR family transcriptional regulator [Rhizobium bangladeshense]MBX5216978.1 LysR family transcriptional regulator [Rhizobium sp. NLR9a]MBX5223452.1 LysR family transcriptional regulator [Rhizobium sp. NLR8a]MBX5235081.1 LysR family transcriptional regulator [Rhizobium sp. NLR4a]MBX5247466.1 LysR family transcriptional regulator [Rhizobium sp. NLR3b]
MNEIVSIDHFNLWSFDLNLLVAFDALMKERSVTKAAVRLKIQQPAMSHNLGTLRTLLQDELFVRVGQVMQPTHRALRFAEAVEQILSHTQQAIVTPATFEPGQAEQIFRIGFSSELEVLLVPRLAAVLNEIAPGIKVLARAVDPELVHKLLDDNIIDLGVGCYDDGNNRHRRSLLFEQSLMCCYNPKLLDLPEILDRDSYVGLKHALVSQKDAIEGCIDDALKRINVRLDVSVAAPEFLTVLTAVLEAPLIATLPTRIVKRYAGLFGLAIAEVPLDLAVSPISMVWSAASDNDPANRWMRSQVTELVSAYS